MECYVLKSLTCTFYGHKIARKCVYLLAKGNCYNFNLTKSTGGLTVYNMYK